MDSYQHDWGRVPEGRTAPDERTTERRRVRRRRKATHGRRASPETVEALRQALRHASAVLQLNDPQVVTPPPTPSPAPALPPGEPEPSRAEPEPQDPQPARRPVADIHEVVARKVRLGLGLNVQETAAWFGGDRGTVAKHLTVVPMGKPGRVEVGRIPARQVGSRRFVLPGDVLGCGHAPAGTSPGVQEKCHGQDDEEASTTETTNRRDFNRSIDQLRHRGG